MKCSTEEKVSCHTIYPHKTGGYIQVVSKQESENLNFEEDSKDKKLPEDDNSILILSEADKANPRIREIINQESERELISLDKSLLDKILDGDPLVGSRDTERAEIVNATEEKERINERPDISPEYTSKEYLPQITSYMI